MVSINSDLFTDEERVAIRKYNRLVMREFHARKKAAGVCVRCGKPSPSGRTYCLTCVDITSRSRYTSLKQLGLCTLCGKVPAQCGYVHCATCRAKNNEYQKAYYQKRKAKINA